MTTHFSPESPLSSAKMAVNSCIMAMFNTLCFGRLNRDSGYAVSCVN